MRIRKLANALIQDAAPTGWIPSTVVSVLDRFTQKHGGLWVGGTIEVGGGGVSFEPNGVNRAVHDGLGAVHVRAEDIREVRHEFGWVTGIVVVRHVNGEFRFRCYGARRLAAAMAAHFSRA